MCRTVSIICSIQFSCSVMSDSLQPHGIVCSQTSKKKKKEAGEENINFLSYIYRKLHDVRETITLDVWGGSRIEVRRGRKRTEYLENILLYSLVPLNFEPCK